MSTKEIWSNLTTEDLEQRRQDTQSVIDENPDKQYTHAKEWVAEMEAELESRNPQSK